jgi:DNA repair protein RadC
MTKNLVNYLHSVDVDGCSVEEANAIYSLSSRLAQHQMKDLSFVHSPTDLEHYLRNAYMGLQHEIMGVVFLGASSCVLAIDELFQGTINSAHVYPRRVVEKALYYGACSVFLFHNHPSGNIQPSEADRRITECLKSALKLVEIDIVDHLIVGKGGTYSFLENHLL